MSLPKELQELQDKRAKLECESRSLKDEQKNLEENVKELEQKTIEALKNENKTTRQAISRLKSIIEELGQRLSNLQTQENSESSKSFLKECVECGKDIPLAAEECQYCGTQQAQSPELAEGTRSESSETMVGEPAE